MLLLNGKLLHSFSLKSINFSIKIMSELILSRLRFEDFFKFCESGSDGKKYRGQINEIIEKKRKDLIILYEDLMEFDHPLAIELKNNPEIELENANTALKNLIMKYNGNSIEGQHQVRITTEEGHCPLIVSINTLRSNHISKLIICEGIVTHLQEVHRKRYSSSFECQLCGSKIEVYQNKREIRYPPYCCNPNCKAHQRKDFKLIIGPCKYFKYQNFRLQTLQDKISCGVQKRDVKVVLIDNLVYSINSGDKVLVTGIFRPITHYDNIQNIDFSIEANYIKQIN